MFLLIFAIFTIFTIFAVSGQFTTILNIITMGQRKCGKISDYKRNKLGLISAKLRTQLASPAGHKFVFIT